MFVFGQCIIAFVIYFLGNSGASTDELAEEDPSLKSAFIPGFPSHSYFGLPGLDYPNHTQIPFDLHFSCHGREPGFYANPEAQCQVYHHCSPDGRSYPFLCGVGTIFNQRALTCDHWYNYDCEEALDDYKYNFNLYPTESLLEENDLQGSADQK